MAALNVMVVDDSIIIRTKLKKMITDLGHNVTGEAGTGLEAISNFTAAKPDIITMDITMPDMDGIEATRILTDADPNVRILIMTSHAQQDIVQEAISAGAKGYVVKPVTPEKLEQRLNQIMEL